LTVSVWFDEENKTPWCIVKAPAAPTTCTTQTQPALANLKVHQAVWLAITHHNGAVIFWRKLAKTQREESGGTLNTWRSGDDGRPVTERLQVRF
jgi:hypothetical protein